MTVCSCGLLLHVGLACLGCGRRHCHHCLDVVGLCSACAERDWNERVLGLPRGEDDDR